MFILDTNIVSNRTKKRPHPVVTRWLAQTAWEDIATTVVTITEIQRGIERVRSSDFAVAERLDRWLDGMVTAGKPQVLPMGVEASRLLGRMYETPALRHFIVSDPRAKEPATGSDLAIAAIAIAAGATVATTNVRHFLQINRYFPLPGLFNPLEQAWHLAPRTPDPSA